jgi:enterochelin esterase-like enzyme
MKASGTFLAALCAVLLCACTGFAQQAAAPAGRQGAGRGGAAQVRSPEIAQDGTVTFRLSAPDAVSVLVRNTTGGFADWPGGNNVTMTKGDNGIWSATIGPLKPEYYIYIFVVDGVQAFDPQNPFHMRDGTRYGNSLRIPGELTADYAVNDVPHGTLSLIWYPSPALKLTRRLYVYTPPGYETSTARYPVFYLLHGGGGDEDAWTNLGRAPQIMDNLIAQGKAKPMIVVMTNENANQIAAPDFVPAPQGGGRGAPAAVSQGARSAAGAPAQGASQASARGGNPMQGSAMLNFPKSIITDVIPFIDKAYRTLNDREHRAIAGLSMGGGMTLLAAFNNLDTFAWVGTFSAGLPPMPGVAVPIAPPPNAENLRGPDINNTIDKQKLVALLPQLNASANARLRLFYVGIGAEDGLITAHNAFKELLKEKGVNATIVERHGYGHEWPFWRISLGDFTSRLFQAQGK